jgi:hypothetical protein
MADQASAGWHADPFGRHDQRFWDGDEWTEHVFSRGLQGVDPPHPSPPAPAEVSSPGAWYADPFGRYEQRYFDGTRWTEHVSSRGVQALDPRAGQTLVSTTGETPPTSSRSAVVSETAATRMARPKKSVQRQAKRAGATGLGGGGGTLFTEPVLVVNQKVRIIGANASYAVYDQRGNQLGSVQEVARNLTGKVADKLRARSDGQRSYALRFVDTHGAVQLAMSRPERSSLMTVEGPDGHRIGEIRSERTRFLDIAGKALDSGVGKVSALAAGLKKSGQARFELEVDGRSIGYVLADGGSWGFALYDAEESKVGSITKTDTLTVKDLYTKADSYVLQLHRQLEEPLRSMVIAAALAIDVALNQG